jgi:hypothetical protein
MTKANKRIAMRKKIAKRKVAPRPVCKAKRILTKISNLSAKKTPTGTDPLLDWMREHGVPITRDKFIALNWGNVPDPWTPEDEDNLPEELQDWSIFEIDGKGRMVVKPGAPLSRQRRKHDRKTR